jgi:hypothetical protein
LSLQIGHRQSIDLDIFSPDNFDTRQIELILSSAPGFHFEFVNSNKKMQFAFINHIKCDFVQGLAKLINPFIDYDGVRYFSVEDIAAMKMHTICGRGKKKDFFDIYALIDGNKCWNGSRKNMTATSCTFFGEASHILKM